MNPKKNKHETITRHIIIGLLKIRRKKETL